jgi:hypothetical protein
MGSGGSRALWPANPRIHVKSLFINFSLSQVGQSSSLIMASHIPKPPTVSGRSTGLYHFFFVPIFARILHAKDFGSFSILCKRTPIFPVISSLSLFSICLGSISTSGPSLSISDKSFWSFLRFVVAVYQNPQSCDRILAMYEESIPSLSLFSSTSWAFNKSRQSFRSFTLKASHICIFSSSMSVTVMVG